MSESEFDSEKFESELNNLIEEHEEDELEQALDLDNVDGIDSETEKNTTEQKDISIYEEELKKPEEKKTGQELTEYNRKDETKKKALGKGSHSVPTTTFRDPITGMDYPILSAHSPYPIVKKILTHNSVTGYTGIINAGMSGTGKTTWTKMLVHNLHQAMPSVVIDWFSQYDLVDIDNIINSLTKGVPHIIIFDDASFALDDLPRKEINKLAQVLTTIRHIVKANVITIMNIHYSKAIGKYWRNIPFYFLTSISSEETGSYEDVFGSGAKWKLRDFTYLFHEMMLNKGWKIEIDAWTGSGYRYVTNKPFRIGLASELNRLHFFVYARDSCAFCDPEFNTQRVISAQDMVDSLVGSYNKNQVRSTLRYYMFTRKGKADVIDRRVRSLWNHISDLDRKNDIDWNHVAEVLDSTLKNKRKRYYKGKQEFKDEKEKLLKDSTVGSKLEQQAKKLDPALIGSAKVKSPDADPLQDNSGDITYDTEDNDVQESDNEPNEPKSNDELDNPMADADWQPLENNDDM